MPSLFDSIQIGDLELPNRIAMAPMTRSRRPDERADDSTAEYYAQRASAGLLISEGTYISEQARGYVAVPGIWTDEQVAGWRTTTDRVHAAGGRICAQLWHVGRMSHSSLQPDGGAPVSASAVPVADSPSSRAFATLPDGTSSFVAPTPPRALALDEIPGIVADYARAARNAVAAGFDGVEIHAANGYLIQQFLNPNVNRRDDEFGGTIENRSRLAVQVVDATVAAIGASRVGIRISPFSRQFDHAPYPDAAETYLHLARAFQTRGLSYVHINDPMGDGTRIDEGFLRAFRAAYTGPLLLAGELTKDEAADLLDRGLIDVAAFGRPFIANPDLVERLAHDDELAVPDRATFYGGGDAGYIDYPALVRDGATS